MSVSQLKWHIRTSNGVVWVVFLCAVCSLIRGPGVAVSFWQYMNFNWSSCLGQCVEITSQQILIFVMGKKYGHLGLSLFPSNVNQTERQANT